MEDSEITDEVTNDKKKPSKNKLIIIGGILVVAVALLYKPHFKQVQDDVVHIVGQLRTGDDHFTIDTYPFEKPLEELELFQLIRVEDTQDKALEGIKYANEELGFNSSLYSKMMNTTALIGRQTDETDKYRVSWTYHPDTGLEVTYEKSNIKSGLLTMQAAFNVDKYKSSIYYKLKLRTFENATFQLR